MVHALKETCRVLQAGGILIDLRPRHENQIIELINDGQAERIAVYADDHRINKDVAVDEAIATVVESHLFSLERSIMFEYVTDYETGTELMDYFFTRNPPVHHSPEIVEKIALADKNVNTTLRFTNDMELKCYLKIDK